MNVGFLNVDLDLESRADLSPLSAVLRQKLLALHEAKNFAVYELRRQSADADTAIRAIAKIIQRLPRDSRARWNRCSRKALNVGIKSSRGREPVDARISLESLQAAARIGAEIVVTIYRP